jgi:hypothetical protein
MNSIIFVTKHSGDLVPFEEKKLNTSLKRAGAKERDIQRIVHLVKENLVDKKHTSQIYREAFRMLKQLSKASAARFNLKRSIMDLGPSGFPFEKYIGELYKYQKYEVQNNIILNGKCVKHELDVIAKKNTEVLMVECKFHNNQGVKSDVKVSLYFKSRVVDLIKGNQHSNEYQGKKIIGCLVTNTRFTEDAIQYAKCENIELLSWDYPNNLGIKDLIELSGLYPLTCLTSLKKREKKILLENGVVLSKTLASNPTHLNQFNPSKYRLKNILDEVRELCNC